MKVIHLIELLEISRDQGWGYCTVIVYDAEAECGRPVPGALFGGTAPPTQLSTDTAAAEASEQRVARGDEKTARKHVVGDP